MTATGHSAANVAPKQGPNSTRSLLDLVIVGAQLPPQPTDREKALSEQFQDFYRRLRSHRFQLAVVGQFKRGKSSLLNALLGHEVLPTGVLPLTALPTFIRGGSSFELYVRSKAGAPVHLHLPSAAALQQATAGFVDERANPANIKSVERVEITVAGSMLEDSLVIIDTPGVGSTVSHNTDAAEASLPECDAALMVLSPDPPITQAELDYLTKIKANAAKVFIAFNKVDLLARSDVAESIDFLRRELLKAELEPEIFLVSARQSLAALASGKRSGVDESGVKALRQRLSNLSGAERGGLLAQAVAQKGFVLLQELEFENDLVLSALSAPLDLLDERLAAFEQARGSFDQERQAAADRLAGDRRRLLENLDAHALRIGAELRQRLAGDVEVAARVDGLRSAWNRIRQTLPSIVAELQKRFEERQRTTLEAAVAEHQMRADELLAALRKTAADLMQVPYRAPPAEAAFTARLIPAWTDRPRESLVDGPMSLLERLTFGKLRNRIVRRRIDDELNQLATLNIEHLRWATRLNIEESLRSFGGELDLALSAGAAAVCDGLVATVAARRTDATQSGVLKQARTLRQTVLAEAGYALALITSN